MQNDNLDFGGFIDDDNPYDEDNVEEGYEEYLTVEALLCVKLGDRRGTAVYKLLKKYARQAAEAVGDGGDPGILFNDDGGEFVSFLDTMSSNE